MTNTGDVPRSLGYHERAERVFRLLAPMETFHKLLADGKSASHAPAEATAVDPLRRPFVCFGA
ncbi:hypothetical protein [Saccharothrix deserti]|uniref:hypothetical protein n=1 Tax=Saccharothrix deserti TaxID=2593674 RepID=UPI00131C3D09|nr:hypothetical protein [Saccharothrix deserti]